MPVQAKIVPVAPCTYLVLVVSDRSEAPLHGAPRRAQVRPPPALHHGLLNNEWDGWRLRAWNKEVWGFKSELCVEPLLQVCQHLAKAHNVAAFEAAGSARLAEVGSCGAVGAALTEQRK